MCDAIVEMAIVGCTSVCVEVKLGYVLREVERAKPFPGNQTIAPARRMSAAHDARCDTRRWRPANVRNVSQARARAIQAKHAEQNPVQ